MEIDLTELPLEDLLKIAKKKAVKKHGDYLHLGFAYGEWQCVLHPQPCAYGGKGRTPDVAIRRAIEELERGSR